ncbi:MAG: hypothetical protein J6V83_00840 [Clostridia bacterium]|nr:hypothetical protein [Clostridia bacterium]
MTERFKKYLEEAFRVIPPTKAAMDYRKATLVKLEEYAQDCRIKGITDEDAIFNLAIGSLGDFNQTLLNFHDELTNKPKRDMKKTLIKLGVVFGILAIIAVYLALSVTGIIAWGASWLILVGAILISGIVALELVAIKIAKRRTFIVPRLANAAALILAFVLAYLLALIAFGNPRYSYFTFLIMVVAVLGIDLILAYVTKSKLAIIETVLYLVIAASLIFVMCGITGAMPWHPGWLLPACAALASVGIAVFAIVRARQKKKAPRVKKNEVAPTAQDDSYYTEW